MSKAKTKSETVSVYAVVGSDEAEVKHVATELAQKLAPDDVGDFGLEVIDGVADNIDQATARIGAKDRGRTVQLGRAPGCRRRSYECEIDQARETRTWPIRIGQKDAAARRATRRLPLGEPPLVVTTHAITSFVLRHPGPAGVQPRARAGSSPSYHVAYDPSRSGVCVAQIRHHYYSD